MVSVYPQQKFFNNTGKATPALLDLLKLMKIEHDGTIVTIQPATAHWHTPGKLRAQIEEQHGDKKADALPLLTELGLIEEVRAPAMGPYLGFGIIGGKITAVRKRMAHLLSEMERGIVPGEPTILASKRGLFEDEKLALHTESSILPFRPDYTRNTNASYVDESMMMFLVFDQSYPVTSLNVAISDHPQATSLHTIRAWKEQYDPPRGAYLIVTSQPDVSNHTFLASQVFGEGYTFHGIGPTANLELAFSKFLDSVSVTIDHIWRAWRHHRREERADMMQ